MEPFPIDHPSEMDRPSQELGRSLDPRRRVRSLYGWKAAHDGGPKPIDDTYAEIGSVQRKIERLSKKLERLDLGAGAAGERHAPQLEKLRSAVLDTSKPVSEVQQALSDFKASGENPLDYGRKNMRRAHGCKIERIFNVIFDFCERNEPPWLALLHGPAAGRTAPFPGQTHPAGFVTGMPRAV